MPLRSQFKLTRFGVMTSLAPKLRRELVIDVPVSEPFEDGAASHVVAAVACDDAKAHASRNSEAKIRRVMHVLRMVMGSRGESPFPGWEPS